MAKAPKKSKTVKTIASSKRSARKSPALKTKAHKGVKIVEEASPMTTETPASWLSRTLNPAQTDDDFLAGQGQLTRKKISKSAALSNVLAYATSAPEVTTKTKTAYKAAPAKHGRKSLLEEEAEEDAADAGVDAALERLDARATSIAKAPKTKLKKPAQSVANKQPEIVQRAFRYNFAVAAVRSGKRKFATCVPVFTHEYIYAELGSLAIAAKLHGWEPYTLKDVIADFPDMAKCEPVMALITSADNPAFLVPFTHLPVMRDDNRKIEPEAYATRDYPAVIQLHARLQALAAPLELPTYIPRYTFRPTIIDSADTRVGNLRVTARGLGYIVPVLVTHADSYRATQTRERDIDFVFTSSSSALSYVHGAVFQGIHFAKDGPSVDFIDMSMEDVPYAPYTFSQSDMRRAGADEVITADDLPTISEGYQLAPIVPTHDCDGEPFRHGFVVLPSTDGGGVVFTTFPNHDAFCVALNAQQASTSLDSKIERWGLDIVNRTLTTKQALEDDHREALAAYLKAEAALAQINAVAKHFLTDRVSAMQNLYTSLTGLGEIASVQINSAFLAITTRDMKATLVRTGEERYCGRFEIQISNEHTVRVRNIAAPYDGYRNPHGWCTGSFGRVFQAALAVLDYHALVLAIMEYYRTFDPSHEGKWPKLPDSLEPVAGQKVYVSGWQYLAGKQCDAAIFETPDGLFEFHAKILSPGVVAVDDDNDDD